MSLRHQTERGNLHELAQYTFMITTSGESGAQFEISAILPKDGIRPRIIDAFHPSLSQAISRSTQSEKSHEVANSITSGIPPANPPVSTKKGHVAANSCAMLCQCCAHQGSYQVSISFNISISLPSDVLQNNN
jgi:hypothetical protein